MKNSCSCYYALGQISIYASYHLIVVTFLVERFVLKVALPCPEQRIFFLGLNKITPIFLLENGPHMGQFLQGGKNGCFVSRFFVYNFSRRATRDAGSWLSSTFHIEQPDPLTHITI